MSLLVGIGGGTGSGKTSLAVRIQERVGEDRCLLLAQDAYYKDGSSLSPEEQAAINYDHPEAYDTSLLVQDLELTLAFYEKLGRTSPMTTGPTRGRWCPTR